MNSRQRPSPPPGDTLAALFTSLLRYLLTARLRLPEFAK